MNLKIKKLTHDAIIPFKAHRYDAGFDMFSNENTLIKPGEHKKITTGIAVDLSLIHI